MSVIHASAGGKNVVEFVESLEKRAASRSGLNGHAALKNTTQIALERIKGGFDAKRISTEVSLKQRIYSVQDKLIELAW